MGCLKVLSEVDEEREIRAGKAVYRLPIVTDAEEAYMRIVLAQCLEEREELGGEVLILVDEDPLQRSHRQFVSTQAYTALALRAVEDSNGGFHEEIEITQVLCLERLFVCGIETHREVNEDPFSVIRRSVLGGLHCHLSCIPSLLLAFLDELSKQPRHATDMDASDLSFKVVVEEFRAWNPSRLEELSERVFKGTTPGTEILC